MFSIEQHTKEVECILYRYFPKEEGYQKTVLEAMNYTMQAGGKRLRPMLMLETFRLFGGTSSVVEPFMAAIEMIHTYSLIHDDLPALDNDDYRRGRKTAHVVYGEAMAILAGDALLNYAYEVACKAFDIVDANNIQGVIEAIKVLSSKPGIYGMIGGQTADVELTGEKLNNQQLTFIYECKTGALIEAAMMIGAYLAGASQDDVAKIEKIASNVGMAFQIQDDILDIIGDEHVIGKPIHSDKKNQKITYATIHGIEAAKKEVERLSREAIMLYDRIALKNDYLRELIVSLMSRSK